MQTIKITVPWNWNGRDQLKVHTNEGQVHMVTVPYGTKCNDIISCTYPKSVVPTRRQLLTSVPTALPASDRNRSYLSTSSTPTYSSSRSALLSTTPFTPIAEDIALEDENVIKELIIQRCMELCRDQEEVNHHRIKDVICSEFGEQRYEKYKSLVEYFINKSILAEKTKQQKLSESKCSTTTTTATATRSRKLSEYNGGVPIELPRLVACVAGCGFWGTPATKNLCNKCYSTLVKEDFHHITKEEGKYSKSDAVSKCRLCYNRL